VRVTGETFIGRRTESAPACAPALPDLWVERVTKQAITIANPRPLAERE
jgi:hypothetical protein